MKVLDYFTIGKLDIYIEPFIKGSWDEINEVVEFWNDIENIGWRLPTLDELLFLHENKSEMKFELGDFWFSAEDGIARTYDEIYGVWKVRPTCKFRAILVKDSIVDSEE